MNAWDGFLDFGDFNDWADVARHRRAGLFVAYRQAVREAIRGQREFWAWALAHAEESGFGKALARRGARQANLERRAMKALEDVLAAYRRDRESQTGEAGPYSRASRKA